MSSSSLQKRHEFIVCLRETRFQVPCSLLYCQFFHSLLPLALMSTIAPRFAIVDDVDSKINYTGPWFLDQGSMDSAGNYGPPYRSTLHGTRANASFSFAFSGTNVKVYGATNIRNDSGVIDPTWQCFVDNVGITTTSPVPFPENNWLLCARNTLLDGPHILTVNATVMNNQTFWFDNIQYIPSASALLDQAAIIVDNLDPQLQFGQGWKALGGQANMTLTPGTTFAYNFIGVSLSWYGLIPKEYPLTPSQATYSIDRQTPISFALKGLSSNETTIFYQKFFETSELTAGPHILEVAYQGNNSTPLSLDYLIVQNGTLSSATTSVSSPATSTTSGNDASGAPTPGKSSTPVGAIVGGVIGGLVLIALILGFLFLRRRQKRAAQDNVSISTPKPFTYTPVHPSNSGTSHSRAPQTTQTTQTGEPPITSSGITTHPTNLRPIPLQRTALALAKQSLPSVPVSVSPAASPPLLATKAEREAEAPAALRTQGPGNPPPVPSTLQNNDALSSSVVFHADSGIRMPQNHTADTSVADVPPVYTPD